mmetsp:Transcript_111815/g.323162  ORF Transcript_111815/g.323162 Transcript_111815/m.323162 type:complete len:248 (+) Transcript_111815:445-1188(+)
MAADFEVRYRGDRQRGPACFGRAAARSVEELVLRSGVVPPRGEAVRVPADPDHPGRPGDGPRRRPQPRLSREHRLGRRLLRLPQVRRRWLGHPRASRAGRVVVRNGGVDGPAAFLRGRQGVFQQQALRRCRLPGDRRGPLEPRPHSAEDLGRRRRWHQRRDGASTPNRLQAPAGGRHLQHQVPAAARHLDTHSLERGGVVGQGCLVSPPADLRPICGGQVWRLQVPVSDEVQDIVARVCLEGGRPGD